MKLITTLLAAATLLLATALPAQTPTSIWGYSAVTSASGSDKLFIYSSSASKTITLDNLFKNRTLVTPTLGVASATTINKVTITAPATGSTLTIADGGSLITVGAYAGTFTFTGATGVTFPTTGTLATLAGSESLSGKTLVSPVISTGLTASGSAANTFAASTGTFITSTGANTLSGAVTIADATTPSLTTAAGKTNSGFVTINGKTSGGLKLMTTDASGFTLIVQNAAVATADRTLTLPDPGGNDSVVYGALAASLSNKTLVAPKIATGGKIVDAGGDEYVVFTEATTPVTYLGIVSGDTGVAPALRGQGETNTGLLLAGTGTGDVKIGDGADITKLVKFELAGATTAKTRQITSSHTDDRTNTIPDVGGPFRIDQASTTAALVGDDQAVTPGISNVIQLTSDDATSTNRTFTLSATGATAGAIYVLIGPASDACELADTSIQKLSADWTPGPTDTLTLLFDGTNFIELARADN